MTDSQHTYSGGPNGQEEALLRGLNPEQKRAVLHSEGPLLILAGAGSGKTRVITHRIAYMVQVKGISPRSILAITFTNKAAREMLDRVEGLLGNATSGMWIGTFHSMMARVLRRFAQHLGFTRNFSIADSADQLSQVKAIVKELNLDEKTFEPRRIHSSISAAKNQLLSPEDYAREAGGEFWKSKVAIVYKRYQDRMLQNNLMDFDDLLYYAVKLFHEQPEVLALYQDRFHYIMVDEYQDTNGAQYELIRLLSKEHRNLCVVGDDDQSIYSFRGADIQNILDFEKDFAPCAVIKLEQNYRSTGHILRAANKVIHNNAARKDKKLWTAEGEGEKITRLAMQDEQAEANFIAREIARLVSGGDINFRDVGILYRINALSRNLEFSLQRAGIPFKIYGGLRFFDRKEIKDTLAYLNLITSPRDNVAFQRAVLVPRRGIGETTIAELQRLAQENNVSIMEICVHAAEIPSLSRAAARITEFVHLIGRMQRTLLQEDFSLAQYIEYVQNESGMVQDIIDHQEKGREEAYNRLENMKELLSEAVTFQQQPNQAEIWDFTAAELAALNGEEAAAVSSGSESAEPEPETLLQILVRFLDQAALHSDADSDADAEDDNFVKLMTIHSAKGLEFSLVFVVGMEEGIFPGYRSQMDPAALEEERRLAYVAITRARKKLYLSASDARLIFGRTERYVHSRFMEELPSEDVLDLGGSNFSSQSRRDKDLSAERQAAVQTGGGPKFGFSKTASPVQDFRSQLSAGEKIKIPKAGNLRAEDIRKGDRVRHAKHGLGRVLAVEPVAGDAILRIAFETSGEKKMLANSANLAPGGK